VTISKRTFVSLLMVFVITVSIVPSLGDSFSLYNLTHINSYENQLGSQYGHLEDYLPSLAEELNSNGEYRTLYVPQNNMVNQLLLTYAQSSNFDLGTLAYHKGLVTAINTLTSSLTASENGLPVDSMAEFDGKSGYIEIPNLVLPSGNFSIETWFETNSLANYSRIIANSFVYAHPIGFEAFLYGRKVAFKLGNGTSGCGVISDTTISPGAWYDLLGSYNGDTLTLYLNGQIVGQDYCRNANPNSNLPIDIGRDPNPASDYMYFPGLISNVRIYNESVSGANAELDFELPLNSTSGHLVGWWLLNGSANNQVSNGANPGIVKGNVQFVANPEADAVQRALVLLGFRYVVVLKDQLGGGAISSAIGDTDAYIGGSPSLFKSALMHSEGISLIENSSYYDVFQVAPLEGWSPSLFLLSSDLNGSLYNATVSRVTVISQSPEFSPSSYAIQVKSPGPVWLLFLENNNSNWRGAVTIGLSSVSLAHSTAMGWANAYYVPGNGTRMLHLTYLGQGTSNLTLLILGISVLMSTILIVVNPRAVKILRQRMISQCVAQTGRNRSSLG
jgi:hypothetical protein